MSPRWCARERVCPSVYCVTVQLTSTVCDNDPLVPFGVTVYVFAWVWDVVETVNVEFPGGATDAGLKLQVACVGQPVELSVTVPTKPFNGVSVTV